ncbi:LysR family transcriptional regulator [Paenarthrobacter nitroguajacolicus]|uniref:LysR family transcriptional regulator n=1 Tax=Paenarthrobacter nitroguajacolicus TaxID=211146 RepID=UPI000B029039|nr:LysR family transcriptional regulator [Paenarthrobacter nitroguajacolicus]
MAAKYTLRQLELFSAAVRNESFAGAADEMYVTPTAISVAVGELEKSFGVQLVTRQRARGILPTPAGLHLVERAAKLLRDAGEIQRALSSGIGELSGPVSLGCYSTLAATILPSLIHGFREQYPGVDLAASDGPADELLGRLLRGRLDLVIAYRSNLPPGLEEAVLYETSVHVLLPAGHRLATHDVVSLKELAEEPLIMLDLPPSGRHTLDMLQREGLTPSIAHRTPNFELVRSMVARGLGYSLLVQKPSIDISYEGLPLVTREISPQFSQEAAVIVWQKSLQLTDRAQALVKYARKNVSASQ